MNQEQKKTILFICTHNSARSQMAEALVNYYLKDKYQAFSAGLVKTRVHPLAIKVMDMLGIDIRKQFSKTIDYFRNGYFDYVVTVCDDAKERCPFYPNYGILLHKSFRDPSAYNTLEAFVEVRNKIREWILAFFLVNK